MGIFDKITKLGLPLVEDTDESDELQDEKDNTRIFGKIIRVDTRGFGFISSEDLPFERIFFHWTSLKQGTLKFPELKRGMKVSFLARKQVPEDKGYKAIRINVE